MENRCRIDASSKMEAGRARQAGARLPAFAVVLVLATGLTAGCGSTHSASTRTTSSTSTSSTSTSSTSTSSTSTSTPALAGRSFQMTATFTTQQGYSFSVTASASMGAPARGDSSQLPPSQDALVMPVSGSETVENTTPGGRDSPDDPATGTMIALYKSPTPVCPVPQQLPGDATYMDVNNAAYCVVDLVGLQDQSLGGINAGQTVTLTPTPSTCQSQDVVGGCGTVPTPAGDTSFVYLASHAQAALAALAQPPAIVVLVGSSSDLPSSLCAPSDGIGSIIASSQPITSCS